MEPCRVVENSRKEAGGKCSTCKNRQTHRLESYSVATITEHVRLSRGCSTRTCTGVPRSRLRLAQTPDASVRLAGTYALTAGRTFPTNNLCLHQERPKKQARSECTRLSSEAGSSCRGKVIYCFKEHPPLSRKTSRNRIDTKPLCPTTGGGQKQPARQRGHVWC